jgi:hypothetical protein
VSTLYDGEAGDVVGRERRQAMKWHDSRLGHAKFSLNDVSTIMLSPDLLSDVRDLKHSCDA